MRERPRDPAVRYITCQNYKSRVEDAVLMKWADHFIDANESPLLMQRYAYLDALNASTSLDPDQHTCYLREYIHRL